MAKAAKTAIKTKDQKAAAEAKNWSKVIKAVRSPKTGAYTFKVAIIDKINDRVKKDKYVNTSELNSILQHEMTDLLVDAPDHLSSGFNLTGMPRPYVLLVVGVNGVGKTTTIGKLAHQFKMAGKS